MNAIPPIPLAVVGCDFRVAPSRARSQLVMREEEAQAIAGELERSGWADGVAFLDTCNRNEWIVASAEPAWAAQLLLTRMRQRLTPEQRRSVEPQIHVGDAAARHLFRVAIGRESLVVGERQIAGQLFRALDRARVRGSSCRTLNGLGSISGRLVRIALRRGRIEASAVGVHSLAVAWLRARLPAGERARVVVVGMGAIGRRLAAVLEEDPRFLATRVNRTPAPGVRSLGELSDLLAAADAVALCSAAPDPILDPAALPARSAERPLRIVDIGIPEQSIPCPGLAGVERAGLDELVAWQQAGAPDAGAEDDEVPALVERAVRELRRYCHEPAFAPVLEQVRARTRSLTDRDLAELLRDGAPELPEAARARLEGRLRGLLADYAEDVVQAIRDGSRLLSEGGTWNAS